MRFIYPKGNFHNVKKNHSIISIGVRFSVNRRLSTIVEKAELRPAYEVIPYFAYDWVHASC